MAANRKQIFYQDGASLSGSYKDNSFKLEFPANKFIFYVEGGEAAFSIAGADDSIEDGVIIPAHGVVELKMQAGRIALKNKTGSVTRWQVWGLP